ncbi:sucrose-6-phosphate hydrolase SacC (GH32 family) [Nocardioides sp. BE266]|uniref:glycoside hydrolase family 32 protein n=1 Tax=Nocardioides sp. BE266 TaxID=2817725 RepID=UPI0028661B12|nr:glycoside hydrolase family 32 protein [Nocardioides sp. BE266]MDR7252565.1 sucrose-6-phosphate hydrolase SacC (GH32 family) [Nocardioides sp. BE266]
MSFDPSVRPRDHFTPRRGWMNDPNGLIHHDGEFHLFFQHHTHALVHGPISWGHAVSTDLLTWAELPTAIAATADQHVWSGSVVHDAGNTSGLGTAGAGPLVALWTGRVTATERQSQSLSFSTDRGRTWTPYADNPVLDIGSTAFRDPKVLRHDGAWVMVVVLADARTVELYRSDDLLRWEHWSSFGPEGSVDGVWECPDLVRVPVEGSGDVRWVLLVSVFDGAPAGGSGMQYFVGELDDAGFRSTQPARWLDHGADLYAGVSYADAPGAEPVVQAWMSNWQYAESVPATEFRGAMTAPRRLALRPYDDELGLVQRPVVRDGTEVVALHDEPLDGTTLPVTATSYRVVAEVETGTASRFGLHVREGAGERTTVVVDTGARTVSLDRTASGETGFHPAFAAVHTAPLPAVGDVVRIEVLVDVSSVEVFVDEGAVALTDQVFPSPASAGVSVFAEGGTAVLRTISVTA